MKISIATKGTQVCPHFGHAEYFTMITVENGHIINTEKEPNPGHSPGALPLWMSEQKVDLVIAGGMGPRAQQHFSQYGIKTLIVESGDIEETISSYMAGTLKSSSGACNHPDE